MVSYAESVELSRAIKNGFQDCGRVIQEVLNTIERIKVAWQEQEQVREKLTPYHAEWLAKYKAFYAAGGEELVRAGTEGPVILNSERYYLMIQRETQ